MTSTTMTDTSLPRMAHVALLRAVNLPGHNKIAMRDLVELLGALGMSDARSLLQSGNLVFRSNRRSAAELERQLEVAMRERLGLATDVMVRGAEDWRTVIARNPFPAEAERDPGHLLVVFLKDAPGRGAEAALRDAITGREVVKVDGRHAYIVYPDGVGRSRLTTSLIERKLGTRGTGRNWNTVLKLGALVAAPGGS